MAAGCCNSPSLRIAINFRVSCRRGASAIRSSIIAALRLPTGEPSRLIVSSGCKTIGPASSSRSYAAVRMWPFFESSSISHFPTSASVTGASSAVIASTDTSTSFVFQYQSLGM